MNPTGALVPSEGVGTAQRNGFAVRLIGFVCQHGICLVALAVPEIEISSILRVAALIYVVMMICCNDQEAEISEITVCLKVLNIGEDVVSVVRLSMVCMLEKFQLYGTAMLGFCFQILEGNPYVNLGFSRAAFFEAPIRQENGFF